MTRRQQKLIWLSAALIFVFFCSGVGFYIGIPMIQFVKTPALFQRWVDSYGIWGRVLFVGMVFLQVIVALIPGEPLEIAAGYAFGAAEGFILAMTGILLGSWVVFSIVRWFGPRMVEVFFPAREVQRLHFLRNPKKTFILAFILMMVPGTPKDLLSYCAGLTPLTIKQWLGIVAAARIPSVLTSVVTGAAAGEKNYVLAVAVLIFTAAVSLWGLAYYRKICSDQEDR